MQTGYQTPPRPSEKKRAESPLQETKHRLTLNDYIFHELNVLIKASSDALSESAFSETNLRLSTTGSTTSDNTRSEIAKTRLAIFFAEERSNDYTKSLENTMNECAYEFRYTEFVCHLLREIRHFAAKERIRELVQKKTDETETDYEKTINHTFLQFMNTPESEETTIGEQVKTLAASTPEYLEQKNIDALIKQEIQKECRSYREAEKEHRELDERDTENKKSLDALESGLKNYLNQTVEQQALIDALTQKSAEEFTAFERKAQLDNEAAFDQNTSIQGEFLGRVEETQASFKSASSVISQSTITKNRKKDPSEVTAVASQNIDFFAIDKDKKTILDKVLALRDFDITDQVFRYAKLKLENYYTLLKGTLDKLLYNQNYPALLHLMAQGCLFDKETVKSIDCSSNLFEEVKDSDRNFPDLFDSDNNIILNEKWIALITEEAFLKLKHLFNEAQYNKLIELANDEVLAILIKHADHQQWVKLRETIKAKYCSSEDENVNLPMSVWEAIKIKAETEERYQKNFKQLLTSFEKTIDHLVSQSNKNTQVSSLCKEKLDTLLRTSLTSCQQKPLAVVKTLIENPTMKKHSSITRIHPDTTTVRYLKEIRRDYGSFSNQSPALSQSDDQPISKARIEETLQKITDIDPKQRTIEAREALANSVFSKAVKYLKARQNHSEQYKFKYNTMKDLIKQYSEATLSAERLLERLQQEISPSSSPELKEQPRLGTHVGWGEWLSWFKGTTTASYLKQGMKNASVLSTSCITL